jgi:Predicted NTPase (NACHT family)
MIEDILLIAGTEISKQIVEAYISPKISNWGNITNSKKIKKHFEEYIKNSYMKHSYVKTIAFSSKPKLLSDIYVPLKIWTGRQTYNEIGIEDFEDETYIIDKYDENLLEKFPKILIIDTAGMGKSTILNKLFLSVLEQKVGYPIFLNLRKLDKKSVIQAILDELSLIDKNFDEITLRKLIAKGNFIFFFDGLDEIPYDSKEKVIEDLTSFTSKAPNNKFIMSSRADSSTNSFNNFITFQILPLTFEEAIELIKKYDDSKSQEISNDLIKELIENDVFWQNDFYLEKSYKNSHLNDFLKNPLLTSLLYVTYEHNRTLAERTAEFYKNVCEALFFKHDSFKEGGCKHECKSKLSSEEIEKILRHIAFTSFSKSKTSYNKTTLVHIIQDFKNRNSAFEFEINDLIDDLITNIPLLIQDGIYYTWCHKSMQEYFFAEYLLLDSGNRKSEFLLGIYKSRRLDYYLNVLELYYDLDKEGFEEIITFYLFQEIIDLHDLLGQPSTENRLISSIIQYQPAFFKIDSITSTKIDNIITKGDTRLEHEILVGQFDKAMRRTDDSTWQFSRDYSVNGLVIELNQTKYLVIFSSYFNFVLDGTWESSSINIQQVLSGLRFLTNKKEYGGSLINFYDIDEPNYLPFIIVKIDNSYHLSEKLSHFDSHLLVLTLEKDMEEIIELMKIYCNYCEKRNEEFEINYDFILNKQNRIKEGLHLKENEEIIF